MISLALFDYIRDKGYGAKLSALFSELEINLTGCSFVDNTDITQTGETGDNY